MKRRERKRKEGVREMGEEGNEGLGKGSEGVNMEEGKEETMMGMEEKKTGGRETEEKE